MHDAGNAQNQVEQCHTDQQRRQGATDPEDVGGAQRGQSIPPRASVTTWKNCTSTVVAVSESHMRP